MKNKNQKIIVKTQKIEDRKKEGLTTLVIAVTGAVVGAGIAVAATAVLKDQRNRQVLKEALSNLKDQAIGIVEEMKEDKEGTKFTQVKEKFKKIANSVKKNSTKNK